MLDMTDVPATTTCFVTCAECHPLDARIGMVSTPIARLPGNWEQKCLIQPCGAVLAQLLEHFIDMAIAFSEEVAEFTGNTAKLAASRAVSEYIVTRVAAKK